MDKHNIETRANKLVFGITGGCGFIGLNLVHRLLRERDVGEIRIIDNLSTGSQKNLAKLLEFESKLNRTLTDNVSVKLHIADIRDGDQLIAFTSGVTNFVHLAANAGVPQSVVDPHSDCYTNVVGTLNCLEAARHAAVKRFVFASSSAPLGVATPPIHEQLPARPTSPYGASKLAGEGYCSAYHWSYNLETVALRFSNVYGPRSESKTSVVAAFIKNILTQKPISIHGDGTQTRDFIFVGDLVDAIWRASTTPDISGEVFQIATNKETSIIDLAATITRLANTMNITPKPPSHEPPRRGDIERSYSDTSKAERHLNWKAMTLLADGLRVTVNDLKSRI